MDDLSQDSNDPMEIEPAYLGPTVAAVLESALAKSLASKYEQPWTEKLESELQEKISALVATVNEHGLKSVRLTVTRPDGQKVSRDLDIDRISRTRSLQ